MKQTEKANGKNHTDVCAVQPHFAIWEMKAANERKERRMEIEIELKIPNVCGSKSEWKEKKK